jgi:hypothetical protein
MSFFKDIEEGKNKFTFRTDHTPEEVKKSVEKSWEMSFRAKRNYMKMVEDTINMLMKNKEDGL